MYENVNKIVCKSKLYSIIFFLAAFSPTLVYAAQIDQIYTAFVPIASELSSDRAAGFDQALKKVLIKASGQYSLASEKQVLANLLPAEPYVQTFSYRDNPAYLSYVEKSKEDESNTNSLETEDPIKGLNGLGEKQTVEGEPLIEALDSTVDVDSNINEIVPLPYLLDVSFASSLVEEKLMQSNIPIWGNVRPSVLLWVVIESDGERTLVSSSGNNQLLDDLSVLKQERGIPIFLPVADLEDASSVNIDDLWGLYPESVELASKRYRPDAIVMLRLYQSEELLWNANWVLQLKNKNFYDNSYDVKQKVALTSMITSIAKNISSKYAINESTNNSSNFMDVSVKGIHNFEDYIKLQRYLSDLPPVDEVEMKKVYLDTIELKLTLLGQYQQFFEHIELGGLLTRPLQKVQVLSSDPFDISNTVEHFIWSPALK